MSGSVTVWKTSEGKCPAVLRRRLEVCDYHDIASLGDLAHLDGRLLALFCSSSCPGNVILDTYDFVRELRKAPVMPIGGFHSPMEQECLELLFRGPRPVIVCPAREIVRMRLPKVWKEPLEGGRLLILSPFAPTQRRVTAELALERNRFVAQLADEVFIAHAAPESKTEAFCRDLVAAKKPVVTLDRPENQWLLDLGAKSVSGNQWR